MNLKIRPVNIRAGLKDTFLFKVLKLSIMTPTNRFNTKKDPRTMKTTKKM